MYLVFLLLLILFMLFTILYSDNLCILLNRKYKKIKYNVQ